MPSQTLAIIEMNIGGSLIAISQPLTQNKKDTVHPQKRIVPYLSKIFLMERTHWEQVILLTSDASAPDPKGSWQS